MPLEGARSDSQAFSAIPVMVIPVLNRFDLLHATLDSIDYPVDEILIINNSGENLSSVAFGAMHPDLNIRLLNLPSNLGVAASWNLGIKLYPHAPFWLIGSADTHVNAGALAYWRPFMGEGSIVHLFGYGVFAIGADIVRQVGLFDEIYYPIYFEDWDYQRRIEAAGLTDRIIGQDDNTEHPQWVNDNGASQTIKSNVEFDARNRESWARNSHSYHRKMESGDWSVQGWNLDIRRQNEWL